MTGMPTRANDKTSGRKRAEATDCSHLCHNGVYGQRKWDNLAIELTDVSEAISLLPPSILSESPLAGRAIRLHLPVLFSRSD